MKLIQFVLPFGRSRLAPSSWLPDTMKTLIKTSRACLGVFTITLGLAVQVQAQSFLTNGLVLYYPFNGNANDASGNGNNGTVNGATLTTNRFGVPDSAYYFNGVSSDILVPETIFGPTIEACTLSIWITTDNGPYTNNHMIFAKSCVNGELALDLYGGSIYFATWLAGHTNISVQTPVRSNSVMHVVAVYEKGQSISLYTDGLMVTNRPVPNVNLWVQSFPLISSLGAYHYTGGPYMWFRGTIDDFRVYTRALSASEVQQLYYYESGPQVDLIKAVKPSFRNLTLNTRYKLQASSDLSNWYDQGPPFTATSTELEYPQYYDVDFWNQLYFRLQVSP